MRRFFRNYAFSSRPAMVAKLMSAGILRSAAADQDFDGIV
jgi:hypothetical protein